MSSYEDTSLEAMRYIILLSSRNNRNGILETYTHIFLVYNDFNVSNTTL